MRSPARGRVGPVASCLTVTAALAGIPAVAQECDLVPLVSLGDFAHRADVNETHLFIANDEGGLLAFDIRDLDNPKFAGAVPTPEPMLDVALLGDLACVAARDAGLMIVDVSDPDAMVPVGVYPTTQDAETVEVFEGHVFLGTSSELHILDLSDPTKPALVGFLDLETGLDDIALEAGFVYASSSSGLIVIDIAAIDSPTVVSSLDAFGSFAALDSVGGYVYVAADDEGLIVIDATDPADPGVIATYQTPEDLTHVDAVGDLLYMTLGPDGMFIMSISDPAKPLLAGLLDTGVAMSHVVVRDDIAFTTRDGFQIIDATITGAPILRSRMDAPTDAYRSRLVGHLLYVAEPDEGITVLDVSTPSLPQWVGGFDTLGSQDPVAIDVSNGLAAACVENDGVWMLDAMSFPDLELLSVFDMGGSALDICLEGDVAFVANGDGLLVLDLSDPEAPTAIAELPLENGARSIAVDGHHAYIASEGPDLHVVDIAEPSKPVIVGGFLAADDILDVDVSGHLAMMAVDGEPVYILSVEDPTNPTLVGGILVGPDAVSVTFAGDRGYVIEEDEGLFVIDLSDPSRPMQLGHQATPDFAHVDVGGGIAYVSADVAGIHVIDVSSCDACPADVNGDGQLDVLDFVAFQLLWQGKDALADCDANGEFNVLDFVCFQQLFVQGCE